MDLKLRNSGHSRNAVQLHRNFVKSIFRRSFPINSKKFVIATAHIKDLNDNICITSVSRINNNNYLLVPKVREKRLSSEVKIDLMAHIFYAILYKNIIVLEEMLESYDIDLNELNEDGIGAMHFASIVDSHESINVLIQYGACVNREDIRGQTPKHYARIMNHIETANLLESKGAK